MNYYSFLTEIKNLPGDETLQTHCVLLPAEEQLPARREQRGRPAGGGEADEAEGAGDAALLQGDAGRRHRAQPALAGKALALLAPPAVQPDSGSPALPSCGLRSITCPAAAARAAATGRSPPRRTP